MSKPPLHVLRLENAPIFTQLQIEEALLRNDDKHWLILNRGSPEAIVMGISGKSEELIEQDIYARNPVPLIRRFSGGGTVFIDPNTLFTTFIGQKEILPDTKCDPETLLNWSAAHIRQTLPPHFSVRENDFVLHDRKFGGNALYLRKHRWLHHATYLWDYSEENMAYLKLPKRIPTYRRERPHNAFLCSLKEILPTPETLFEQMLSAYAHTFSLQHTSLEAIQDLLAEPHRRSTRLEFNPNL